MCALRPEYFSKILDFYFIPIRATLSFKNQGARFGRRSSKYFQYFSAINEIYNSYEKMVMSKFVDSFEINNIFHQLVIKCILKLPVGKIDPKNRVQHRNSYYFLYVPRRGLRFRDLARITKNDRFYDRLMQPRHQQVRGISLTQIRVN